MAGQLLQPGQLPGLPHYGRGLLGHGQQQEQFCWWLSQASAQVGHFGNSLCCTSPQSARWLQRAKLQSPKLASLLDEMEQQLFLAWNLCSPHVPSLVAVRAFGMCCCRMALHVVGKEQLGFCKHVFSLYNLGAWAKIVNSKELAFGKTTLNSKKVCSNHSIQIRKQGRENKTYPNLQAIFDAMKKPAPEAPSSTASSNAAAAAKASAPSKPSERTMIPSSRHSCR